jgi:nitrogen fixation protein FixH
MTNSSATPKPLTGRFVLVVTVTFFAVVIGVNMLLMHLAVSTLPGTDVDSAYRGSLAYQSEIDAAHDQDMRHWIVDARIERGADGLAAVRVEAHDHDGRPLSGVDFSGRLERPADKREDKPLTFAAAESGVYRGNVSELAPGVWDLVLEGDVAGKRVFLSKNRVILN